jgi:hypothetical protein
MKTLLCLVLALAAAVAGPAQSPLATVQPAARPVLAYDYRPAWRLGAPALAAEEFPEPKPGRAVLYLGQMRPRGLITLRAPGDPAATPAPMRRTLRSVTVDLTRQLTLVSALHQAPGGSLRRLGPEQLPKLHVRYDPAMPETLEVPSRPGTCVLLFEIGDGAATDWAPGEWTVHLRFDAAPLDVQLTPFALGGTDDPGRPPGTAALFEVRFSARKVETQDDELNVLWYQAQEARSAPAGAGRVADYLQRILAVYPTEGNLRLARAQALAETGRRSEAAAEARLVLDQARAGQLRSRLRIPVLDDHTRGAAQAWIEQQIEFWNAVRR